MMSFPGSSRSSSLVPNLEYSQFIPMANGLVWNISDMPWSLNLPPNLMEFKATSALNPITNSSNFIDSKKNVHSKRRAEMESFIPSKQLITEDKMAAHLSNLHISSDYTTHTNNSDSDENNEMSMENDSPSTYTVNMAQWDLERKLKNAQRITICDEVRKLDKTDSIIPKILLDRIEKPCSALVLWQPPRVLDNLIVSQKDAQERSQEEEEQDNNNSSSVDLNNFNMDIEM